MKKLMMDYIPNYSNCNDTRKEIKGLCCKHMLKDFYMFCMLNKEKRCPAWKGYQHKR